MRLRRSGAVGGHPCGGDRSPSAPSALPTPAAHRGRKRANDGPGARSSPQSSRDPTGSERRLARSSSAAQLLRCWFLPAPRRTSSVSTSYHAGFDAAFARALHRLRCRRPEASALAAKGRSSSLSGSLYSIAMFIGAGRSLSLGGMALLARPASPLLISRWLNGSSRAAAANPAAPPGSAS